jgi:hypothetical protein
MEKLAKAHSDFQQAPHCAARFDLNFDMDHGRSGQHRANLGQSNARTAQR